MKKVRLGRNIYPDLTEELLGEIQKLEDQYSVKVYFLFEEGIEIHYPDSYDLKYFPGDISFWHNDFPKLVIVENIGSLEFSTNYDDVFLSIPTCSSFSVSDLVEKLRKINIVSDSDEEGEEGDDN